MKKFLTICMAMLMICCAMAFTACGDKDESNKGGNGSSAMNETKWNAMFVLPDNYSVAVTTVTDGYNVTQTTEVAVGKVHRLQTGTQEFEDFASHVGDKYYGYSKDGENWSKEEISQASFDGLKDLNFNQVLGTTAYADFTYDATNNVYTHADTTVTIGSTSIAVSNIKLTVANDKIATITLTQTVGGQTANISVTFTYGNVSITLPVIDA